MPYTCATMASASRSPALSASSTDCTMIMRGMLDLLILAAASW